MVKISIVLSDDLHRRVERLSAESGVTKTELLRRAIQLLEVAVEARSRDLRLGIFDAERKLVSQIIGF